MNCAHFAHILFVESGYHDYHTYAKIHWKLFFSQLSFAVTLENTMLRQQTSTWKKQILNKMTLLSLVSLISQS